MKFPSKLFLAGALCVVSGVMTGGAQPAFAIDHDTIIQRQGEDVQCGPYSPNLDGLALCEEQARALLLSAGEPIPATPEGCQWEVSATPMADMYMLYRALRCGTARTQLEVLFGNHSTPVVYRSSALGAVSDPDGDAPQTLVTLYAGDPDGRARSLWQARYVMSDKKAAARCELKPAYSMDGLPYDAMIVDTARSEADTQKPDARPLCGDLGYNPAGGSIDFWRTNQGFAWYFTMPTDVWDVDPGSLTLIARNESGAWQPVPTPLP